METLKETMAPVQLQCPVGGACDYQTQLLEYAQAEAVLDRHLKYSHQAAGGGGNSDRKPEKFPRPTVGLHEPIEKWEDFRSSWQTKSRDPPLPRIPQQKTGIGS